MRESFPQLCCCAGGVGAAALTPALLAAIGFNATGITAGSLAAKLMAYCAVYNGGGVVAGSLVSILQSLGKLDYLFFMYFFCLSPISPGTRKIFKSVGRG